MFKVYSGTLLLSCVNVTLKTRGLRLITSRRKALLSLASALFGTILAKDFLLIFGGSSLSFPFKAESLVQNKGASFDIQLFRQSLNVDLAHHLFELRTELTKQKKLLVDQQILDNKLLTTYSFKLQKDRESYFSKAAELSKLSNSDFKNNFSITLRFYDSFQSS